MAFHNKARICQNLQQQMFIQKEIKKKFFETLLWLLFLRKNENKIKSKNYNLQCHVL